MYILILRLGHKHKEVLFCCSFSFLTLRCTLYAVPYCKVQESMFWVTRYEPPNPGIIHPPNPDSIFKLITVLETLPLPLPINFYIRCICVSCIIQHRYQVPVLYTVLCCTFTSHCEAWTVKRGTGTGFKCLRGKELSIVLTYSYICLFMRITYGNIYGEEFGWIFYSFVTKYDENIKRKGKDVEGVKVAWLWLELLKSESERVIQKKKSWRVKEFLFFGGRRVEGCIVKSERRVRVVHTYLVPYHGMAW
jgi:hypothetical protein